MRVSLIAASCSRRRSGCTSSGRSSPPGCTATSGAGPSPSWCRRRSCSPPAPRWRTSFLRTALNFLLGFGGNGIKSLLTVTDYLSFVTHLLIVFGASFLFPLLIILLNLAGVVSAKRLAKWRRIEIFLVFVFAGFVTPSRRSVHDARARPRAVPALRGRDPGREVERPAARASRRDGRVRRRWHDTEASPARRRRSRAEQLSDDRAPGADRAAALRRSAPAGTEDDDIT